MNFRKVASSLLPSGRALVESFSEGDVGMADVLIISTVLVQRASYASRWQVTSTYHKTESQRPELPFLFRGKGTECPERKIKGL